MRDIIGEMGGGYAGHYWRDGVGYDGRMICGTLLERWGGV